MNVHASALAEAHLPDEQTTAFAREAIEDLSQQPKQLSPKYFYDATGSELFEAITRLPEYYPTRTELAILKRARQRDRENHPGACGAGRIRRRRDDEGPPAARTTASSRPMCPSTSPATS